MPRVFDVDVSVPKGYKGVFKFACNAAWPQNLKIGYHNEEGNVEPVAERNNTTLDDWETPVNESERDNVYTISGEYKDRYDRWQKSNVRKQQQGNSYRIGFDDGFGDGDYNDIVTTFELNKIH
ncbi:hypothetical protein ACQGRJ_09475 [Bacillus atrophaeus]|uniref:hypothetical protein n=1 Tax=Bacillus atrophaeus TaxID=1452 RepID=UPI003CF1EDB8